MLRCYRFGFMLDLWLVLILVGYYGTFWFRFRQKGPGLCFTWLPSPSGRAKTAGSVNGLRIAWVLIEPLRSMW